MPAMTAMECAEKLVDQYFCDIKGDWHRQVMISVAISMLDAFAAQRCAELERERDEARETARELNRKNGELTKTLNKGAERKAWYGYYSAAMQLFKEEATNRETAESLLREREELLRRIIDELPTKRDWLDPDLERMARAALRKE